MARVPSKALLRRVRRSAIVARLVLTITREMQKDYRHAHIGAVWQELMVAMVVRVNDADGGPPMRIADIARELGMPWQTAKIVVEKAVKRGVVRANGGKTYVGEMAYLAERIDAHYFRAIVLAISRAAAELRKT